MDLAALLDPRCPNHPNLRVEPHGLCIVCELTTHCHLAPPPPELSPEAKAIFDRIAAVAERAFDQEGENIYDGYDERIWDE